MKRIALTAGIVALIAAAFVLGTVYRRAGPGAAGGPGAGHHDHAAHMAHAAAGAGNSARTFMVAPEQQQLIGVRIGEVEQGETVFTRRVPGRVAVDETRLYRLTMAVDGWVQQIFPVTTGSLVRKDQPLLSYYSPEFLGSIQAYFYALGALDRYQASGTENAAQIALTNANIQQAADSLRNLGMGELQIEELRRTRQSTKRILVRAPANGFVIARNVFPGQRLERGAELYRIADLDRVWILADAFEKEADALPPGWIATVSVPGQDRSFKAQVSGTLPQFDPATRTLKIRLEASNLRYLLRPDMFVDVELPVRLPSALTVAASAVLDSGLAKTVFVDRGNGTFERRTVETGWRMGDRVEILRGLAAGERVAVAGTFLLDSESRMRLGRLADAPPPAAQAARPPPLDHPAHAQPATAVESKPTGHEQHGHHD